VLRLTADDGSETVFDEITVVVQAAILPSDPPSSPTTISFQVGGSYSGTRDTMLLASSSTKTQGSSKSIDLDASPDTAGIIKWDISSIPVGSVVQSATITLNVTKGSDSYQLYELLKNWAEGSTTWNNSATGKKWDTAGAQGSNDRGTTLLGTLSP